MITKPIGILQQKIKKNDLANNSGQKAAARIML